MGNSPKISPTCRPRIAHTDRSWGKKIFLSKATLPQPAIKFNFWQNHTTFLTHELFATMSIDTNEHDNDV